MDVQQIAVSRATASGLYRKYREHQHYSNPIDHEIMKAYLQISRGHTVIRAIDAVKAAGLNDAGLPKLAIGRADKKDVDLRLFRDGGASMIAEPCNVRHSSNVSSTHIQWPAGTFARRGESLWSARAMIPLIPLPLRPKRALQNYHILFEAEWSRVVPVDPLLLRRIGKADLWVVVAQWDLTPVEVAALQTRVPLS